MRRDNGQSEGRRQKDGSSSGGGQG
jgi:hypothetical protein